MHQYDEVVGLERVNCPHVWCFMQYLLIIRRNDGNANLKNKFYNRTNIDFVKVTEFGLAVMSLWHCFTFIREQHINFAYVWAIYDVIYRRIMVIGKYHAQGFVRHRDVWNKLCPLDHQTTGCNLRCFRPHSAVLIVLPRISSSKRLFCR